MTGVLKTWEEEEEDGWRDRLLEVIASFCGSLDWEELVGGAVGGCSISTAGRRYRVCVCVVCVDVGVQQAIIEAKGD